LAGGLIGGLAGCVTGEHADGACDDNGGE
jgi:hypothetical protein